MDNSLLDELCQQSSSARDIKPQLDKLYEPVAASLAAEGLELQGGWFVGKNDGTTLALQSILRNPGSGHGSSLFFTLTRLGDGSSVKSWTSSWNVLTAPGHPLVCLHLERRPPCNIREIDAFIGAFGQIVAEALAP